jgi:hypothetical protein
MVAVLMAAPTSAWAKGPDQVTITGPSLSQPINVVPVDAASSAQLDLIRQGSGIEAAMFAELPGEFAAARPAGDLGPQYRMTWNVPGDGTVAQDLYPYAAPSPAVFTPPQRLVTRSGWFTAPAFLKDTLHSLGLPAEPPRATAVSRHAGPFEDTGVLVVVIAASAALGLALAAWRVRGRRRRGLRLTRVLRSTRDAAEPGRPASRV